jgi:O-antigen/teichoic acid export membrane protein
MQRLQRMITLAARSTLILALPAALVLILFARQILGNVFGPAYETGAACLAILCAGQLINSGAGSVGLILNMTGHERDSAFGLGIGALTNVTLNIALIPLFDIAGAALATGTSLIAWNIVLALRVHQRLGLDSTALGLGRRWRIN